MEHQICMFEYCSSLILENSDITDLQIEKVYTSFFELKRDKRKIEKHDVSAVVDCLSFCTKYVCLGMGIGWSERNHTIVDIDRQGIEFDHDGRKHSFKEIALLLMKKYC